MARGFYSLVQYCPDRFRAETVNLGLVLLCIDTQETRVRIIPNNGRVRNLFDVTKAELKNLKLATDGLQSRIEKSADEFKSEEDLIAFATSRANDLRLTEPRLTKIDDVSKDFERLFKKLVSV